jgi:predicted PurR-regulated permease PerM
MTATPRESERRAVLVVLAGTLALTVFVLWPLAQALFLAAVLSATLAPLYRSLEARLRGRSYVAGGLVIAGVLVLVLAPLVALTVHVVSEAGDALRYVTTTLRSEGVEGLLRDLPGPLERAARAVLERVPHEPGEGYGGALQQHVSQGGSAALGLFGSAVAATGALLFQAVMMMIALFFLLTEHERALAFVDEYSPLGTGRTRELVQEFRQVTVAVLQSSVLTALVQAVAALVGYLIAGAPQPLFFTALTFLLALIPAIGATAVVLLLAGLQALTGHTGGAIFLVVWGFLVVGLVDNLVKPLLIRGGVQLHGAVVFFALIGGLAAFGAIGLVLGPLAAALLLAVLRMYRRDFAPE